jgi:KDO2-lipid IV(A) lauroyltransferase
MNKRAKLLYGLVYLLSLLPLWVHYLCSDVMYLLVYKVLGYRVKVVRQNLSRSFPEQTEKERRQTERQFYKWLCDYAVETIKLTSISRKQIRKRLKFVNSEVINEIIKEGQSCAVYLGHYCNWEWVTSLPLWTPEEAQCGQIYHAMENGIVDQVLLHVRQRLGAISIPMAETLRQL